MFHGIIHSVLVIVVAAYHIHGSPALAPRAIDTDELGEVGEDRPVTIDEIIDRANNGKGDMVDERDNDPQTRDAEKIRNGRGLTIDEIIDRANNGKGDEGDNDPQTDDDGLDEKIRNDRGLTIDEIIDRANDGKGDVVVVRGTDGDGNGESEKRSLVGKSLLWPNVTIPYQFSTMWTWFNWERAMVRAAMDEWENYTCIKFVLDPRKTTIHKIDIQWKSGCYVERVGFYTQDETDPQIVSLGWGCWRHYVILHELGHVLGYHHEQTRFDRDDYITMNYDNMINSSSMKWQYRKLDKTDLDVNEGYDYRSIMHYGPYAGSNGNGKPVFKTIDEDYQDKIGKYKHLSFSDVKGVNLAYKCAAHCTNTCPLDGYLDENCVCMCHNDEPTNERYIVPCDTIVTATTTSIAPDYTIAPEDCLHNWQPFEGRCYVFAPSSMNLRRVCSVDSVREECQIVGAQLTRVRSASHSEFLVNLANNGSDTWGPIVIGGRYNASTGEWRYPGGDAVNDGYTNWDWGYGAQDVGNHTERCMMMQDYNPGLWQSRSCTSEVWAKGYICEMSA